MINERAIREFCPVNFTQIENYYEALADKTQTWILHHIKGETMSMEELIEKGLYFNQPPQDFKFVTKSEHNSIHHGGKKRDKGTCDKISKGLTGQKRPNAKDPYWLRTEEVRNKISESQKGKKLSEEHKKNVSKSLKGKPKSEFGKAYLEKYGVLDTSSERYKKQAAYFKRNHKLKENL